MYQKRIKCVICELTNFENCFNIINTINYVSSVFKKEEQESKELNFVGCLNCGCIQLQNLFDPNEIYNQKSHFTSSDIWKVHNKLFVEFILKESSIKNILEIGGGSGKLADQIIQIDENINYNIFEISPIDACDNEKIKYVYGNCESYNFNTINVDTIIMSHVFEHLYEPKEFINNLSKSNISNIFISNPDMENLLKNGDLNTLNIQHTFYIDTNFLTYLFSIIGYKLNKLYNYQNNSVFYHFVKDTNTQITNFKNIKLLYEIKQFYLKTFENINNIIIDKPFYICPSGFYGIIVYNYLPEISKKNIIGFLDSDKYKIGNRLCGTNCIIYDKQIIKNMSDKITILLIAKKYNIEITNELQKLNQNINLVNFEI